MNRNINALPHSSMLGMVNGDNSIKSTIASSSKSNSNEHKSTEFMLKDSVMELTSNENHDSQLSLVSPNTLPPNAASRPIIGSLASALKNSGSSRSRLNYGFHQSMPSVHGRSQQNLAISSVELAGNQTTNRSPKRLPKHQRNFSLDSR